MKPWLKFALKAVIGLAIIFFLAERLVKSYSQIADYEFTINYGFIALSIALGIIGFLMLSFGWKQCLRICGGDISTGKAIVLWFRSQMAKYLPGTVWYFICRARDCSKLGISKKESISSLFFESLMLGVSALIFSMAVLAVSNAELPVSRYALIAVIILGLASMHPAIVNRIAALFKKDVKLIHVNYSKIVLTIAYYMLCWAVIGFGFYILAKAIYPVQISTMPYIIALFLLSWVIGFVSVFAPGGIGVREGIIVLLLSSITTAPIAIVIAFASRIWWTIAETSIFAASTVIERLNKRYKQN
ncbi:MAG: flippase-like domain-containing protein [Nanoarchaeota archaeon]|nr:flippase-like domain-containing protein [Nanoarchaeota archaeon]